MIATLSLGASQLVPHTRECPFCSNMDHECHKDSTLWWEYLEKPYMEGLLTLDEARRILAGKHDFLPGPR